MKVDIIGYVNNIISAGENSIVRCWEEEGKIYLHTRQRSGLFLIEHEEGKRMEFLASIAKMNQLWSKEKISDNKETIYEFMEIRNNAKT